MRSVLQTVDRFCVPGWFVAGRCVVAERATAWRTHPRQRMGGCLVSSLSMARFKDTNNVLALAFSVLMLATWLGRRLFPACVNADMIEFVGLKTLHLHQIRASGWSLPLTDRAAS